MKKRFVALKPFNNKIFYKNEVFNENSQAGSSYLIAARKLLAKNNIVMNTIDLVKETSSEKEIHMEVPFPWELGHWIRIVKNRKKNIAIIAEPPLVSPFNFMKMFYLFFPKVYLWHEDWIDNVKYFKYYLPKTIKGLKTKEVPFKNKKLLVMMNGNWLPFLPFKLLVPSVKELYTERIKALDFFETYYPSEFSLYGRGWNKPARFSVGQRIFGYKKYKTYKGGFDWRDKYKVLSRFKFCLCFENSEVNGYLSEKIFDCFKAKCVPLYRGTPNIEKYIPKNCFIDLGNFKNYQDLYTYLKEMKESEYKKYMKNIKELLVNKKFRELWFEDGFARFFLNLLNEN